MRSSRESQLHNIKSGFIHENSLVFTRSVSSSMFYVPEARTQVSRQSLKYRGTVLLNHLLKTKLLPRNYESIGGYETKRLILKIKNKISSERLVDIVFCFLLMPLCLEGPPPFRNINLWRVPSGAIFYLN